MREFRSDLVSSSGPSRRALILSVAGAGAMASIGGSARAAPAQRIRHDIASKDGAAMIALYAKAVEAMQDPGLNYPPQPRSWIFQSYIHSIPIDPFDPANSNGLSNGSPEFKKRVDQIYGTPKPGSKEEGWKKAALACWATCTHGSPYFTVWHRWYMYYFERICRHMSGSDAFTLPYWNYASNTGSSLQLPEPFRTIPRLIFDDRGLGFANGAGTGAQNIAMNAGGYMPYPLVDYGPALSTKVMFPSDQNYAPPGSPAYLAFGHTGRLECAPHDMVHDSVGGWMGNVPSAAGDPIFYAHHCQVDRLYASWEALGGEYNFGTSATQPPKAGWLSHPAHFVDETGTIVDVVMGGALNTATLGYAYDTLAKPQAPLVTAQVAAPSPVARPAAMNGGGFRVGGGGASVTLAPRVGASANPTAAAAVDKPATLVLQGLKLLRRPPAPLAVFVNLPEGTKPTLDGPYYAGTINLFRVPIGGGTPMAHDAEGAMTDMRHDTPYNLDFDVGAVLGRQKASGAWTGGPVTVTVTTIGAQQSDALTYMTFDGIALEP